jgi:signal transduction histidine kinase
MKHILELLEKFLPVELAVITVIFVYILIFFKQLSDKFVDLADKQARLSREQAEYMKERLEVVEKTLGINDRAIDLRKKQIEELAEIAEERDRQFHDAQKKKVEVEEELKEISVELQAAQARYAEVVEQLRLQEQEKEELRQASQQLESSVQAGFARVFAHELRGTMQSIVANIEILSRELEKEPESRLKGGALAQLQALISRVSDQIGNTAFLASHTNMSKIEVGTVELADTLEEVVRMQRELTRVSTLMVRIEMDTKSLTRPRPVRANAHALQIVLNNIIDNAVKYSFSGTAIHIRVEETEDSVDVLVSNVGIGIAPDEMDRIFDLGYRGPLTTDRFRTGMGLGLPIARRLVDGMFGSINISSQAEENGGRYIVSVRIRLKKG